MFKFTILLVCHCPFSFASCQRPLVLQKVHYVKLLIHSSALLLYFLYAVAEYLLCDDTAVGTAHLVEFLHVELLG